MSIFLPFGFGKRNDSINNAFYYTGKDQTFNFVGGFTYTIYAWGAAGSTNNGTYGGYGAYITGVFSPSTSGTATIIVGQVGQGGTSITSVFYGGGAGGSSGSLGNGHGGGYPGGGRCSFKVNTTEIVTCGGGGGGANGGGTGGNGGAVYSSGTFTGNGGSGTGTGSAGGGGGGTSSSGGGAGGSYDPGDIAGYKDTGGYGAVNAGGGGGGYYGGGGGGNNSGIGGGGGGSSYINTAYFSCISAAQGNAIPVLASFTSGSTVYNLYNAAGYPAGVASSANTGSALIIIIQNPATFKPTYLPGCTLWLDGADTSSNSMTFSSGSNLSTWKDKSGNGNNFSLTSGTTSNITDNGYSVISFPNGAVMTSANTVSISSNSSLFVVSKLTSMSAATIDMLIGFPSINSGDFSVRFGAAGLAGTPANTGGSGYEFGYSNYYVNGIFNPSNALSFYSNVYTLIDASAQSTTGTSTITLSSSFLSRYFIGNIAEFIYYANSALTTAQRRKIEMYLAWKWGLGSPLSTFSPANIAGLTMWLDAADATTLVLSGSNVTQWRDKSGSGNNMIPYSSYSNVNVSNAYQNGLNVVNFSGNGILQSPASSAVYPLDCYIVLALKDTTSAVDFISIGAPSTDNFNSLTFSEYTTSRWHNGSSGFGRTPNTVSTSNETSTSFLLMNWTIANNNFILRRNGVQLTQTNSYTFSLSGGSIFQLGYRNPYFGYTPNHILNGYIAEIVVYNSQLGTSQQQQVEGYLAWKWGLQSSLPSSHPSYYAPPASQVVFTPLQISGLTTWLDGADTSTMTFSSGSNISNWRDKSGNVNNFSLTSGTTSNITDGGYSVVSFPSGAVMTSTNKITFTTSSAFFIVSKLTTNSGITMLLGFSDINPSGNVGDFSIRFTSANLVGTPVSSGGPGELGNNNYYTNGTFNPSFGSSYYYNVYSIIDTVTPVQSGTSTITLSSSFLSRYFIGNIAEFIYYAGGVTSSQRQQIEGYLAWKWGLQSSLPSTHPYYKISP